MPPTIPVSSMASIPQVLLCLRAHRAQHLCWYTTYKNPFSISRAWCQAIGRFLREKTAASSLWIPLQECHGEPISLGGMFAPKVWPRSHISLYLIMCYTRVGTEFYQRNIAYQKFSLNQVSFVFSDLLTEEVWHCQWLWSTLDCVFHALLLALRVTRGTCHLLDNGTLDGKWHTPYLFLCY